MCLHSAMTFDYSRVRYIPSIAQHEESTMNQTELNNARRMLTDAGYTCETKSNAITVQDPQHTSGPGGTLIPSGFKPVQIKSYQAACKFIDDRS